MNLTTDGINFLWFWLWNYVDIKLKSAATCFLLVQQLLSFRSVFFVKDLISWLSVENSHTNPWKSMSWKVFPKRKHFFKTPQKARGGPFWTKNRSVSSIIKLYMFVQRRFFVLLLHACFFIDIKGHRNRRGASPYTHFQLCPCILDEMTWNSGNQKLRPSQVFTS